SGWPEAGLPKGHLMSVNEAAKEVEDYLFDDAVQLAQLKKVREKLTPSPQPQVSSQPTQVKPQQPTRTLTNAHQPSQAAANSPRSWNQRRQAAIEAATKDKNK